MDSFDCIYVAASAYDARYTRICIASIRFFYPHVPIRLLVGGPLQRGLADELQKYWNVGTAKLPASGDYGWGFVKLEPLFGTPGERFLILDSDTVITGPVLDLWRNSDAQFLVDDETPPDAEMKGIYYDWEKVRELDPEAPSPYFLFNTGQWFGTSGVLRRDDFTPWVEWTMPRNTTPPGYFKNGEQGILNYVLNRKAIREGLPVQRKKIMCWPGRSMEGLNVETVATGAAPPLVVHWAGLKKSRLSDMAAGDLLAYFENMYYEALPVRDVRKIVANCQHTAANYLNHIRIAIRLALNRCR
jgi:hypothetical protein